jgi:threonine/homoserine/homoserine lactone efflux protein
MSEEISEAMGTILGLIFGGLVLLVISAELNTSTSAIIEKWGVLFLIVAFAGAVVIVYTLIENLLGGLQ